MNGLNRIMSMISCRGLLAGRASRFSQFGVGAGFGGGPEGAPPPPPGGYPQPGGPQYPVMSQPPKKESNALTIVLIGCGALLVLGLIAGGVSCYFMMQKGGAVMKMGLEEQKRQFTSMLTEDHSFEEEERFTSSFDELIAEYERLGLIEWSTQYSDLYNQLQLAASDQKLTVEESQGWCDAVEEKLYPDSSYDDE